MPLGIGSIHNGNGTASRDVTPSVPWAFLREALYARTSDHVSPSRELHRSLRSITAEALQAQTGVPVCRLYCAGRSGFLHSTIKGRVRVPGSCRHHCQLSEGQYFTAAAKEQTPFQWKPVLPRWTPAGKGQAPAPRLPPPTAASRGAGGAWRPSAAAGPSGAQLGVAGRRELALQVL